MGPTRDVGCVICSEAPDSETEHEGHYSLFGERTYKAVLTKIFQHLLIPNNDAQILYWICRDERFCSSCLEVVEEIDEFQSKIQALEVALQHKVEVLGNVIAGSSKYNEKDYARKALRNASEKATELWTKFRNPVLLNYKKGSLPNPSVPVLKNPVDMTVRVKRSAEVSNAVSMKRRKTEFYIKDSSDESDDGFEDNQHSMGDFIGPDVSNDNVNEDIEDDVGDVDYMPGGEYYEENPQSKKMEPTYAPRDPLLAALPNGSDLITSYDCTKCNFSSPFDFSECKDNSAAWRILTHAKAGLIHHYAKMHCPVRPEDFTETEDEKGYYKCSLCSEQIVVELPPTACKRSRQRSAHIRLTRHYLNIHETVKEPPRPAWCKPEEDKLEGLLEGFQYFRCPKELCSFVSKLAQSGDRRTGLPKIANHYMRMHEIKGWCKTDKDGKYPCLVKLNDGRQMFKCPRCKFSAEIKPSSNPASNIRRKAYSNLLDHFIKHIYALPTAKTAIQCTLCNDVVRFPDDYTPKRLADGERKMKNLLGNHYKKVHRVDEIPDFEYYERIPSSLSRSKNPRTNSSRESDDVLSKAVASLEQSSSSHLSPQKRENMSKSLIDEMDEVIVNTFPNKDHEDPSYSLAYLQ